MFKIVSVKDWEAWQQEYEDRIDTLLLRMERIKSKYEALDDYTAGLIGRNNVLEENVRTLSKHLDRLEEEVDRLEDELGNNNGYSSHKIREIRTGGKIPEMPKFIRKYYADRV